MRNRFRLGLALTGLLAVALVGSACYTPPQEHLSTNGELLWEITLADGTVVEEGGGPARFVPAGQRPHIWNSDQGTATYTFQPRPGFVGDTNRWTFRASWIQVPNGHSTCDFLLVPPCEPITSKWWDNVSLTTGSTVYNFLDAEARGGTGDFSVTYPEPRCPDAAGRLNSFGGQRFQLADEPTLFFSMTIRWCDNVLAPLA